MPSWVRMSVRSGISVGVVAPVEEHWMHRRAPAISGGQLYVGTADGRLVAFAPQG